MNGPLYSQTSQLHQYVVQLGLSEVSKKQKSAWPLQNPRCLFSLSILIPNSFTSNNSNVLVCQTFLTVVQAKQAAPSFSLYSHCSRTSSRSLSLKVCPRRGERRTHNKRTLYITGKTSIFRWEETTHLLHLELVQFLLRVFFSSLRTKNKSIG